MQSSSGDWRVKFPKVKEKECFLLEKEWVLTICLIIFAKFYGWGALFPPADAIPDCFYSEVDRLVDALDIDNNKVMDHDEFMLLAAVLDSMTVTNNEEYSLGHFDLNLLPERY